MMVLAAADCGLKRPWQWHSNAPTVIQIWSALYTQPLFEGLGSKPWQSQYAAARIQQEYSEQGGLILLTYMATSLEPMCGLQLVTMLSDLCSAFCELSDDDYTRYR